VEESEFLIIFSLGALFGMFIVLMVAVGDQPQSSSEMSFEQLNNTYRDIGVNTSSNQGFSCSVSRLDEVQISRSTYIYRNASCTTTFEVGGSGVDVPTREVDLLFRSNGSKYSIGFELPHRFVECGVSEDQERKSGDDSWVYGGAECSTSSGSLYEEWDDPEFKDFNVHDRGQELLQNESNSSSR